MYRIILISVSTLVIFCACLPARTPRIYNVLISTKKNLSPSHALPVYEPVLRTSLTYSFPQFLYNTPFTGIAAIGNSQFLSGPAQFPEPPRNPVEGSYQQPDFFGAGVSRLPQPVRSPSALQPASTQMLKSTPESDSGLEPLPVEHYIPYSPLLGSYAPFLPKELQNVNDPRQNTNRPQENMDSVPPNINNQLQFDEVNDAKQIIANLRKNSGIPDVPPPPLPVKVSKP